MAAGTFVQLRGDKWIKHRANIYTFALDNSYATGGYALTANNLGLNRLDFVIPIQIVSTTPTMVFGSWDSTNSKLLCFWCAGSGAAAVQVTNATDLSAFTATVLAYGK